MMYFIFSVFFVIMMSFNKQKNLSYWYQGILMICLMLLMFKNIGISMGISGSNQFYPFFMDWVGFLLIVLSIFIVIMSIWAGFQNVKTSQIYMYMSMMNLLLFIMCVFFTVWNLMIFFFSFEFVLLPMMIIISVWSSQNDRLMANYYFFFYTIVSGMPFLIISLYLYMDSFNSSVLQYMKPWFMDVGIFMMLSFLAAFMCKLPVFSLHIWLPKAHVEAPVGGSMVLAGLLLKMGGYSIIRFTMVVFVILSNVGITFFFLFLVVGILFPVMICFRQVDLKSFIAYSSVSHMCMSVAGLFTYLMYSFMSSFIVFMSHSVVSPAMFYLGNLIYERINSRSVLGMSGFEKGIKGLYIMLVLFFLGNISFPPLVTFFGELYLYLSMININFMLTFFLFVFFISASVVTFSFLSKILKNNLMTYSVYKFNTRELFQLYNMMYIFLLMFLLLFML